MTVNAATGKLHVFAGRVAYLWIWIFSAAPKAIYDAPALNGVGAGNMVFVDEVDRLTQSSISAK